MHIPTEIGNRGGLLATHDLYAAGATRHTLRAAVAGGSIVRVRQGWYALPDADEAGTRAARVGGRLTCVSGARHHGLWVSSSTRLHVRVGHHDGRLRSATDKTRRLSDRDDVRVHWRAQRGSGTRFVLIARDCLRDMAWCQSPERVVAAADSAIRLGHITRAQWSRDIVALPRRLRRLLRRVDPKSESFLESIVRFRLEMLGYSPRVQVKIVGVGRVDLMLGGRLVIELDGWEFHSTREAFEEDRRRDAVLAARGYLVLRFTYRQVTQRWHEVLAAIRNYLTAAAALDARGC
jgi:very-short-patch-repair endonuclease